LPKLIRLQHWVAYFYLAGAIANVVLIRWSD
jgi:hypothetical protein